MHAELPDKDDPLLPFLLYMSRFDKYMNTNHSQILMTVDHDIIKWQCGNSKCDYHHTLPQTLGGGAQIWLVLLDTGPEMKSPVEVP